MGILKDLYHGKSGRFGENRFTLPEYIITAGKFAYLKEEITKNHPEISELFVKY